MAISYIDEIEVKGKRVFIRADFNVPLDEKGTITDDTRIKSTLPTVKSVLDRGGSVILASHLGRPKGKVDNKYSLAPVARRLSELLGREIVFIEDCVGQEAEEKARKLNPGEVALLENLRFYPEEEKNDDGFARKLAGLADIYINDAFAVSHRAHASVEAITRYAEKAGAGFLLKNEISFFNRAMDKPEHPLVAIVGGAKVSGKLEVLETLIQKVDSILVGGGMAFTFLKSQGKNIGNSMVEDDLLETAKTILSKAEEKGVKLILPLDCVIAEDVKAGVPTRIVSADAIPDSWKGLDIGPETIELFNKVIREAKTIVWNGPMGVFEIEEFSKGTFAISDSIAGSSAMSVVGGGDSVSALKKSGNQEKVTFVSTAGGAFMEMMEGKNLPGIAALDK
jgi:3-phosphoglycerate kinase